jgi:hypothetical protein
LLFILEPQQSWFRLLSNYDGFTVLLPVCQAKSSWVCNAGGLPESKSGSTDIYLSLNSKSIEELSPERSLAHLSREKRIRKSAGDGWDLRLFPLSVPIAKPRTTFRDCPIR